MARELITIDENDVTYQTMVDELKEIMKDENLIVVARSRKNKKDKHVKPFAVKNGIYFYVAYNMKDKIAYPTKYTEENIATAKENTVRKAIIGNMFVVLSGGGSTLDDWTYRDDNPMYILTNKEKLNGAGILICEDFLKALKNKMGCDYRILPSSIHEVIIVPKNRQLTKKALDDMVKKVNETQVKEEDWLANRSFRFNEWVIE